MLEIPDGLSEVLSARHGHFAYESGHHGRLWLDLDHVFVRPSRLRPYVHGLADRLAPLGISAVCGPLTGGGFLAQLVAERLDVESYYTERILSAEGVDYRVPGGLRPDLRDKPVAVVDDVVNAGSATGKTLRDLRACGARPVALAALLTLGDPAARLAKDNGLRLETIASTGNDLWSPDECPLCREGHPMDEP